MIQVPNTLQSAYGKAHRTERGQPSSVPWSGLSPRAESLVEMNIGGHGLTGHNPQCNNRLYFWFECTFCPSFQLYFGFTSVMLIFTLSRNYRYEKSICCIGYCRTQYFYCNSGGNVATHQTGSFRRAVLLHLPTSRNNGY